MIDTEDVNSHVAIFPELGTQSNTRQILQSNEFVFLSSFPFFFFPSLQKIKTQISVFLFVTLPHKRDRGSIYPVYKKYHAFTYEELNLSVTRLVYQSILCFLLFITFSYFLSFISSSAAVTSRRLRNLNLSLPVPYVVSPFLLSLYSLPWKEKQLDLLICLFPFLYLLLLLFSLFCRNRQMCITTQT